jgi:hypothetical protein
VTCLQRLANESDGRRSHRAASPQTHCVPGFWC